MGEPIAIIGSGVRLPGGANSPSELWTILEQPRDLLATIPETRFNARGFHHPNDQYHGHSNVTQSYLLDCGVTHRLFDAKFFNINPAEAAVMDPQVRLLLEVVYEALEAAGLPMERLRGSDTAVYSGLMMGDYEKMMLRDEDTTGAYHVTGTTRSLVSNRISYFFDWNGPSITIDTACSSSLVAVHQAVQQLRSGQSNMAVATGANLILDPQYFITESKLHMLSPDGRSRMWDKNANGYARGDGIAAVVLKRLRDAQLNGDHIECVIRETGVNQDGRSMGITMPNPKAQAQLIQDCYRRAGLDLSTASDRPQYFEAHGTGTPAGDPAEAEAISLAMPPIEDSILRVGSIKTVMGHAEGAAGLAALIKTCLALRKATIPPNMLLGQINPKVACFTKNVEVPTSAEPWPRQSISEVRRASVLSSFGFGGTNAHAILENYDANPSAQLGEASTMDATNFLPFIFSSRSEASLISHLASFRKWLQRNEDTVSIPDLAYTLCARRSTFPVSISLTASSAAELGDKIQEKLEDARLNSSTVRGGPATRANRVLLIFTGQGAAWPGMGKSLVAKSPACQEVLKRLETRLGGLPAPDRPAWSLSRELLRPDSTNFSNASLAQPLCTALQILQIQLLRSAGIPFTAVVGHSSGEIAAAHAAGLISAEDAICIAYQRGLKCSSGQKPKHEDGAMMVIGSSLDDVQALCDEPEMRGRVCVAAVNSSSSITVSGDADAIAEMKIILEDEKKFVRILQVDQAYHSHHMAACSKPYLESLAALNVKVNAQRDDCAWFSSVLKGKRISNDFEALKGEYWEMNLVRPVLFMQAVRNAFATQGPFDLVIEVGPHPALKSPTSQTISELSSKEVPYCYLSDRGEDPILAAASALGFIRTHVGDGAVDLEAYSNFVGNRMQFNVLKDLPAYSWDHEVEYWHESRLARAIRTRADAAHELLGHLAPDSTDHQKRWRNILRPQEVNWLVHHRLQGQIVFPAAGYIVAAIEASLLLCPRETAQVIEVLDLEIVKAMTFDRDNSSIETVFSVMNMTSDGGIFRADFTYHGSEWDGPSPIQLLARGRLHVSCGSYNTGSLPKRKTSRQNLTPVRSTDFYEALKKSEYEYSGPFAALRRISRKLGAAKGDIDVSNDTDMLVHPATLDAAFQSILVAHSYPFDGRLWSMHVPRSIRAIRVDSRLCLSQKENVNDVSFEAVQSPDSDVLEGDVELYTPDSHHSMIQIDGLLCVPFSRAANQASTIMFSHMVWDADTPDASLVAYDGLPTPQDTCLVALLERAAVFYLRMLDRGVARDHPSRTTGPLSLYYKYASCVVTEGLATTSPFWEPQWEHDTPESVAEMCQPHSDIIDFKLLQAIGVNIVEIGTGAKKAIEIGMADNLLADYYQNAIGMSVYTKYLARLVKQIAHKSPHMHILEVGAGTGGATRAICAEIGGSFASYTFTDISSGFFDASRAIFGELSHRSTFRVLDISRDPGEQGFEASENFYDLVVASMVLHATPDLGSTLRNVRKLLKPGGYLVALEGHNNNAFRVGTIFGAFPGWWLGSGDDRHLSPCVDLHRWDELLRSSGFSGCDTVTPDPDPLTMPSTLFVSQAVDDKITFLREPLSLDPQHCSVLVPELSMQNLLLLGGATSKTSKLLNELRKLAESFFGSVKIVESLAAIDRTDISSRTVVLSAVDLDEPAFAHLNEQSWEAIKALLNTAPSLLWVTHASRSDRPYATMMKGMLRTSSREIPTLDSQIIESEDLELLNSRILAELLLKFQARIAWKNNEGSSSSISQVEQDMILTANAKGMVPRLKPSHRLNCRYNSSRLPVTSEYILDELKNVQIERTGDSVVLRNVSMHSGQQEHKADVRVSKSVLSAIKVSMTGFLFLSIGENTVSGKQVVSLSETNSRHVSPWTEVIFPSAPGLPNHAECLALLSQHLLISAFLDGLSDGDKVILHEPDETIVAAALLQSHDLDIDVICTTGTRFGNPQGTWIQLEEYASDRTLRSCIPDGVSAILDLSAHSALPGRIRALCHRSCRIDSIDTLSSQTPSIPVASHKTGIIRRLQRAIAYTVRSVSSINHDTLSCSRAPTLRLSDLPARTEELEALSILDWNTTLSICIIEQPVDSCLLFRASGTYWLAGLSGGLGLSLCEWMLRHGAQNVVISSRNPNIDNHWLEQMNLAGNTVKVISCDLTDKADVTVVYSSICSTLPPIIGVAQGAMVLHDTSVGDMTFDMLSKVLEPKVQGSLHLDELFKKNTLDFFVFFSSVSAVVGNPGQSNYSAANFFMAALAARRRQCGLAASIINIGPVVGVGYIAQEGILTKTVQSQSKGYMTISERDFHQMFAEAVIASPADSGLPMDITTGVQPIQPNDIGETFPGWATNPIMSHFVHNASSISRPVNGSRSVVPTKTQLSEARSRSDVQRVVRGAFLPKLCSLFQIDTQDRDQNNVTSIRLNELGIDSLLAVEVRGWFMKTLEVNIPVLRILNGASAGELIDIACDDIPESLIPHVPRNIADPPEPNVLLTGPASSTLYAGSSPVTSVPAQGNSPTETQSTMESISCLKTSKLSFTQVMFWIVASACEDPRTLNHSGTFLLSGRLRTDDLGAAVCAVGRQHEALRTCFFEIEGEPRQGVMDSSTLYLEQRMIHNSEEVQEIRKELHEYTYDIGRGETMRVALLSLTDTEHYLIIGAHGLVMDGLSFQVFMKDLARHYTFSGRTSHETRQFEEFAQRQHHDHDSGRFEEALAFWKSKYTTFPPELPIMRVSGVKSRPTLASYDNQRFDVRIDSTTRAAIGTACRRHHVTAFHFFLTIFRVLLMRHGGAECEDVSIGVGDANRTEDGMMESIGMFLNLLPLRFRTKQSAMFTDVLLDTRDEMYDALKHSCIPFQVLLDGLEPPRTARSTPVFQAFIDYRQGQRETVSWVDCQLEMIAFQASKTPYDVALDIIDDAAGECLLMFQVREDIYDKNAAGRLATSYRHLAEAFAMEQNISLVKPGLFTEAQTLEVLRSSRGPYHVSEWPETISHRFDDVARAFPADVAIVTGDGSVVTYEMLSGTVYTISYALQQAGAKPGSRVAVLQEPTALWVASFLAILHCGAAYVPLDLNIPWSRLSTMVNDCEPSIVLLDSSTEAQGHNLECSDLNRINVENLNWSQISPADRHVSAKAQEPAMILYSSGSTGTPKGIMLMHEGLRNWIEPMERFCGIGRETVLQQSSMSFDMSFTQISTALLFGGTLCLLPRNLRADASAIVDLISSRAITYTCATPSEYSSWLRYGSKELLRGSTWKVAVSAGEEVNDSFLLQLESLGKRDLRLFNMYGPTEISIVATATEVPYLRGLVPGKAVSAGRPLPNYSVYVVDEYLHPLPAGVQGEIYIGGAGVSSGYLNNPALNIEKFVVDVFASEDYKSRGWTKMHRTGDVGRWADDGGLLVEGRISGDTQVKLRGLRVDLRDVEVAIVNASKGQIAEAVVTLRKGVAPRSTDSDFLVAHVLFDRHCDTRPHDCLAFLKSVISQLPLPRYMCPAVCVPIDHLPRTASFKLDRKAVAELDITPFQQDETRNLNADLQDPTDNESLLRYLWVDVIPGLKATDISKITRLTDFFHIGGTSLLLLALQARIREMFGHRIPLIRLFQSSTLHAMSQFLEERVTVHPTEEKSLITWADETGISQSVQQSLQKRYSALWNGLEGTASVPVECSSTHCKVVVLTGSTGFLGRALLSALVADSSVATVHCVAVRQGTHRHNSIVADLVGKEKVRVYDGDLCLPRLGLSEEVAQQIFSTANTVIHCGADVSYLKGYASLRPANLESTKELTALCLPYPSDFHYISTAGVGIFAALTQGQDYEFAAASAAAFPPPVDVAGASLGMDQTGNNYRAMTATKWASEHFLERVVAAADPAWNVYIHRPSLIVQDQGKQDRSHVGADLARNVRHYSRVLHAIPVIQPGANGSRASGCLDLVDLDKVVTEVIRTVLGSGQLTFQGTSRPRFLHHLGGVKLPLGDLRVLLQEGTPDKLNDLAKRESPGLDASEFEELEINEWAERARGNGMDPTVVALLNTLESSGDIVFPRFGGT